MGKVLGGILLIVGTSIGSGLLALPVVTAAGGFYHSSVLLIFAWSVMTLGAFYILEANLWLPPNTNMISMARLTLGRSGKVLTWFCFCLLQYALLAAYTSGGADMLHQLFAMVHIQLPSWLDICFFVIVLAAVVYHGVKVIDWTNRLLMSIKLVAYALVVVLVMPHFNPVKLEGGHFHLLGGAILVAITSFGYAAIIPPLRNYFKSDVKQLKQAIAFGGLISLCCYLAWDFTVQGNIAAQGKHGLLSILHSSRVVSQLTTVLSQRVNSGLVFQCVHLFTSVCLTTSFLGVGLSLIDFVHDGFSIKRDKRGHWMAMLITFVPPTLVVFLDPGLFILALRYAGIFCVILLVFIPAVMVWSGRYRIGCAKGFRVAGGKVALIAELLIASALLIYGMLHM